MAKTAYAKLKSLHARLDNELAKKKELEKEMTEKLDGVSKFDTREFKAYGKSNKA